MGNPKKGVTFQGLSPSLALRPGETLWAPSPTGFCCHCQKDAKVYGLKFRIGGKQRWLVRKATHS